MVVFDEGFRQNLKPFFYEDVWVSSDHQLCEKGWKPVHKYLIGSEGTQFETEERRWELGLKTESVSHLHVVGCIEIKVGQLAGPWVYIAVNAMKSTQAEALQIVRHRRDALVR